ncbi:urease accessory protein UreE [Saccharospirillum impatiens]|uniref:urease accessory protein UreE n=1 Tax=Saccharospirillum impatiens TaxID=169438 RepID=UPI0004116359|nr:urease accessory protein UreE [Saccharospirillum impatiens]
MLTIHQRLGTVSPVSIDARLTLTHDQREKGRLRATCDDGEEIQVFLERGKTLDVGEILKSDCGKNVQVAGAIEPVSEATCDDWETFAKACYHLGNRHVKVEVGDRWLRIRPDHVLEAMLIQQGLTVKAGEAVFKPESGAYAPGTSHGHSHHASHGHAHAD